MHAMNVASYVALAAAALMLAACPGRRDPDAYEGEDVYIDDLVEDATEDAGDDLVARPDAFIETAPRAIAPMASATVTSQQPTFHFSLPPAASGVVIEVCADRACTSVEQTFAATGVAAQATGLLTPGVHFWRLRDATSASNSWWFWVGVRNAAVDTSWGAHADTDGDGLPEILVGANSAGGRAEGRVYVYPGRRGTFATEATMAIDGTENGGRFGWGLSCAGDVNGDGYVDVVVGAPYVEAWNGRVYILHGSPHGLGTTPDETLVPPETMGNFGSRVASAGDVNGDGYADVLVSAPSTDRSSGSLMVYAGSRNGLLPTPMAVLRGTSGPGVEFGSAAAAAGDVNGDGFGDLIVGAGAAEAGAGLAVVYLGYSGGLHETPVSTLQGSTGAGSQFGSFVSGAGDVNGDGYADVIVAASGATTGEDTRSGSAYVFLGGATVHTMPQLSLNGPDGAYGGFGWAVSGAGDVNHDGFDDVLVGAPCARWERAEAGYPHCGPGMAYVFNGRASMQSTTAALAITGLGDEGSQFGCSTSGAGDVNGDGIADIVVGAYAVDSFHGGAYVYPGSGGGLPSVPIVTLRGTTNTAEQFGWSVASRESGAGGEGSRPQASGVSPERGTGYRLQASGVSPERGHVVL